MLRLLRALVLVFAIAAAGLTAFRFWPRTPLAAGVTADTVLVLKDERRLVLLKGGRPLKSYRVSLGWSPRGHKRREGDGKTPEGHYVIDSRNAGSGFHRALHISYPRPQDSAQARKQGVSPGGQILIHGIKNGAGWIGPLHSLYDWTNGCIAVTDAEIREIWRAVPTGTPVEIRP